MKILSFFMIAGLAALALVACNRDYKTNAPYSAPPATSAYIKIIDASPSFRTLSGKPDSFNVYVNGAKVNATFLTYGGLYPTITSTYATVPAGQQSIRLSLNGVNTSDSVTITTIQKNLTAGMYYTFIVTDSVNSNRDSSRIFVRDSFPTPAAGPGFIYLRLANAVMNDTAGTMIDLYSARRNQVLFTKVNIGQVTSFSSFPTTMGVLDTFYVRRTGTNAVLAKLIQTNTFVDQRYYTFVYAGDTKLTSGTKAKGLTYFTNK